MTSKFSIDNRELLQRISSGEAVVGIDFGNLIVRELAAFRLVAMGSEPVAYIFKHPAGRLFWSLTDESNKGHDDVMPVYDSPQSPGSEPATVPGKWIPVSERLPEDSGRYWCYVEEQNDLGKSHYQWNCSWNGDRWWVESEGGGIVTHWMPLPAAPQEVNRE